MRVDTRWAAGDDFLSAARELGLLVRIDSDRWLVAAPYLDTLEDREYLYAAAVSTDLLAHPDDLWSVLRQQTALPILLRAVPEQESAAARLPGATPRLRYVATEPAAIPDPSGAPAVAVVTDGPHRSFVRDALTRAYVESYGPRLARPEAAAAHVDAHLDDWTCIVATDQGRPVGYLVADLEAWDDVSGRYFCEIVDQLVLAHAPARCLPAMLRSIADASAARGLPLVGKVTMSSPGAGGIYETLLRRGWDAAFDVWEVPAPSGGSMR